MKLFNKIVLAESELENKLDKKEESGYRKGFKAGEGHAKERLENLEKAIERKTRELEKLNRTHGNVIDDKNEEIERLTAKIEVLEDERDDIREVVKKSMENEDLTAVLSAKSEALEARQEALNERESQLGDKEEKNYKSGYADGSADMARKIGEITQADRDNAMKVALVSASSHTPVENMKEINANVKSLTSGTSN